MSAKSGSYIKLDGVPVVLHRKAGRNVWSAKISLQNYSGTDGNRVDRGTGETDLERAKIVAYQIHAELLTKQSRGESIKAKKFEQVLDEYLSWLHSQLERNEIKRSMVDLAETTLVRYYKPYFQGRDISSVSRIDLIKHHDWRMAYEAPTSNITYMRNGLSVTRSFEAKKPSIGYIRRERSRFNSLMKFAASHGYIDFAKIPKHEEIKGATGTGSALEEHEIRAFQKSAIRIIQAAKQQNHQRDRILAFYRCLFVYLTGCRPQEIKFLTFSDLVPGIDKSGSESYLVQLQSHHLKNPDHYKTHKRKVTPQRLFGNLIDEIRACYHMFDSKTAKETDFIFHTKSGAPQKTSKKILPRIFKESGLEEKNFSLYSFRHTFITERLYEQQDAYFVARWAGTSLEMIDKHYSHVRNDLEHEQGIRPANTVYLEPFDLETMLNKTDKPDVSSGIFAATTLRAEVAFSQEEVRQKTISKIAQHIIDNYQSEFCSIEDIEIEEAEEIAAEMVSDVVGQEIHSWEIAEEIMRKLGRELRWV